MKKQARYNKQGDKFAHCVTVAPKPGGPSPTYSYQFPYKQGVNVIMKWAQKVRPIKDLTRYLQGCALQRYRDYLVEYNGKDYEYWFRDAKISLLFSLRCSLMQQTRRGQGHRFRIECPHCRKIHDTHSVRWTL